MARYRKNESGEQSSDEEELFSYLKKVHTVKEETHNIKQASTDTCTEQSHVCNPDDICHVKKLSDNTASVVLEKTDVTSENALQNSDIEEVTDETFDDSKTNRIDLAAQCNENKKANKTDENRIVELRNSEHNFEQHVQINSCTESKTDGNNLENFRDSRSIEVNEEQYAAKKKTASQLKGKDTEEDDDIVSKKNSESLRESDKYYLINEKDWLSLCAKLSSTDKQSKLKEQQETCITVASETSNCDKQDVVCSVKKTQPLSSKGKSMFSAFKQYNPVTKATLRKANLNQKPHIVSSKKVNVTIKTKKPNVSSKGQTKSPFTDELNTSNNEHISSEDPKTTASPKVEIVYIQLEDGQIKYDSSKSPLAATACREETNLPAVKKLDFSEHKQEIAVENRPSRDQRRATDNLQHSSQGNDNGNSYNFLNAVEENCESSYHDTLSTETIDVHYDTEFKPGMQVRFVRINNKLTRVYENFERTVVDEVLNSSVDDDQNKSYNHEHSCLDYCDNDQDSFNFDDSYLVAFPLNAVDPEIIKKDDRLVQLTPKLDILNTSGKPDSLTPNKTEFLTPSKQSTLTPTKLEMFTPNKLEFLTPSKLDILSTSVLDIISDEPDIKKFDHYLSSPNQNSAAAANIADVLYEHHETESPIVLKVTKEGGLVQCKSNESSSKRNIHLQNLRKTFKPEQKRSKANGKQNASVRKSECSDYKQIESSDDRSELSSDEDDLTNYFSMTNHISENSVNACQSIDIVKQKSEIPSCPVSIQASLPDSGADSGEKEGKMKLIKQKARKRKFSDVQDRKTMAYEDVRAKNAITEVEFASRVIQKETKVDRNEELNLKIDSSFIDNKTKSYGDSDRNLCLNFQSDSKDGSLKKKKGNGQILRFYKDFNYKQVEFEDFELEEAQKSKATNMDKEKVDSHIERNLSLKKQHDKKKLKKRDKVQSTNKIKEIKVNKTKLNDTKEVNKIDVTFKEQGERRGNKKCLKTALLNQKESKMNKKSDEETNQTGTKPRCKDDITETFSNDESQKKIEFLEKLFQIKLKEAATDTATKKIIKTESSAIKTLYEQKNESVKDTKLNNKQKSAGATTVLGKRRKELTYIGKRLNVTCERIPRVKKGKKIKYETVSIVNKEKDLNSDQLDKTAAGSRRKYKCSDDTGKSKHIDGHNTPKMNLNLDMDTLGIGKSVGNERVQNCDETSPPEVKDTKRKQIKQRKQKRSLGDQKKNKMDKAQILQTTYSCDEIQQGDSGDKSNNQGIVAKRKSRSTNADKLKTEKSKRQKNDYSLAETIVETEFTKSKKPRGKPNSTKMSKKEKSKVKSFMHSVNDQQGFKNDIALNNTDERKKRKPSAQTTKNISEIKVPETTKMLNSKRKKSKSNKISNTGKLDSVHNFELPHAIVKGNTDLVDEAIESQIDNTVNCDEKLSSNYEYPSNEGGVVSTLAAFQLLQKTSSKKLEKKTKDSKRKKTETDKQSVSKSKNIKQQTEVDNTFSKAPILTHDSDMSKLKLKQFNQDSISYLHEDERDMPFNLSLSLTDAQEVKQRSSDDVNKNSKMTSQKRLKDEKVLEKSLLKKVSSPKKLKSTRKLCSSRKIKTVSKRQEKESWKDMLDDGAFKLICTEKMNEKHKSVNVKHMIRDILKSVKGTEKISERHEKHRERKDGIHKHSKSIVFNTKNILTSESDDAWLSDSGPGVSFPAFKFTGICDSEENRASIKSQIVENKFGFSTSANKDQSDLNRSENERKTKLPESKLFKQTSDATENNYIELHHSPLNISNSLGTNRTSSENSDLTAAEPKDADEHLKQSPEMRKNVDKLRALLDKVSDIRVVKNLQFADAVGLSDTEH